MSTPPRTADAAAFIVEAERMTNERDVDGIRTVFAADARWTATIGGLVVDRRMYGFSDARPDSSPVQNLRMLVAHPITALAFARARFGTRA